MHSYLVLESSFGTRVLEPEQGFRVPTYTPTQPNPEQGSDVNRDIENEMKIVKMNT